MTSPGIIAILSFMLPLQVVKAAPPGVYAAFALALFVWHVGAALASAAVADRLGISDSGFDLGRDLKKMAACSLAALAVFLPLFYFTLNAAVFILYLFVFTLALKFAYLGANHGFLLLAAGGGVLGMVTFVPLAIRLKLPGIFALYLLLSSVFLLLLRQRRRRHRALAASERAKELRIRRQAAADPEFIAACWRCRFYRQDGARCLLRDAGEEVREIRIGPRSFCTSFQAAEQAGRPTS